ncbi:SH3 domain-containing protein [Brucella intermedia]|uniref:SH3 domain-containing protein n=1 Tax=Brucella intermedia TaxID=94625 RepID=UPI001E43D7EA|nr:SH3 domain-containing protein [Brucella intermedia]MCB4917112.1 SH3 domain-containing protein [Brucella intermedia]
MRKLSMVRGGAVFKKSAQIIAALSIAAVAHSPAWANLTFSADETPGGLRFILVSGEFEYQQDLSPFQTMIRERNPLFILFDSPGGNPSKAMELGRIVRAHGLATFQTKELECASACALAFFGGKIRYAAPGAIGVHKSSFSDTARMTVDDAVSAIQHMTAETIAYMTEMGVDPALLRLSLQYDSDDIRYLSKSEMEAYRVITSTQDGPPSTPSAETVAPGMANPKVPEKSKAVPDYRIAASDPRFQIPVARTGRVRHPKAKEFLRSGESQDSPKIAEVYNGNPVKILAVGDRWYRVEVKGRVGYLHHNWVKVDQFVSSGFENRYIQIASFDNYHEAEQYVQSSPIRLAIYFASNSWFAITLPESYSPQQASELLKLLKKQHRVPEDAFMTVGNTYVKRVCCE